MDQVCRRICRICLISNSDDSLLFTNQCLRVLTVFDCYKILTQSDHNQEEYHMSSMCLECVKKMVSFIEFRCLAIKNNDYFTKLKNGNRLYNLSLLCFLTKIFNLRTHMFRSIK